MKLYYSPNACSLSPHIVLREADLKFELEKVDLSKKQTASGENYLTINPKGYVPALKLDNGEILTEGPAIVQYLADLAPQTQLAPSAGTLARYHCQEWLNFIATEIHKPLGALFKPNLPEEYKKTLMELLTKRFNYLEEHLANNQYLMGDNFTVADAYLFTVSRWTYFHKIDLKPWPKLANFINTINKRVSVQAALQAEETGK